MWPSLVVVADPIADDCVRLSVGLEAVLQNALEFQRSHERFGNAVLFGRMRQNKLLMQSVRLRESPV